MLEAHAGKAKSAGVGCVALAAVAHPGDWLWGAGFQLMRGVVVAARLFVR